MPDLVLTIGAFLVALAILIAVHEFGHFWVAQRLGVRVLRFSIGFGKPLLRWVGRRDGTEYVIAALPLGGYVKMLDEREGEVPKAELHRAFNRQLLWKRTAIVAAGPLFNFLFAAAVYWGILVVGDEGTRPLIGSVTAESMADEAGFAAGDELLRVGERPTPTWEAAIFALMAASLDGEDLPVRVRDSGGDETLRWLDGERLAGMTDSPAVLANLGFQPARPALPPVIGEVVPDGVAAQAGLRAGDRILAAGGEPVASWADWVQAIRAHPGDPITLEFERDGQTREVRLTPETVREEAQEIGRIGVVVEVPKDFGEAYRAEVRQGPLEAIGGALTKTADMTTLMVRISARMLVGQASVENLSGPITIAETAGKTASYGLDAFAKFLAAVSISLAVLNLLPIPVLDGGHLLYFLIEWIKGSPLSDQAQMRGQHIGVVLLAALIGLAFYLDLSRLLG